MPRLPDTSEMSWIPYENHTQVLKEASAHVLIASVHNCPELPYATKFPTAVGQAHAAALALRLATRR